MDLKVRRYHISLLVDTGQTIIICQPLKERLQMPLTSNAIIPHPQKKKHLLHSSPLMPKRLIRRPPLLSHIAQRHRMMRIRRLEPRPPLELLLRCPIPQPTPNRALHPLILIRRIAMPHAPPARLVAIPLDAVAAAGTAARAEEPEEAGGPGEGDGEPDSDVDAVA